MGAVKVSIIIATYNRPQALRECLDALYVQVSDRKDVEIIVVDDGGYPHGTACGLRTADIACVIYISLPHRGAAAARNKGLSQARGDMIVFIDDDSIVVSGWAAALRDAWDKYPDADGIGGYVKRLQDDTLCSKVNADLFNWYLDQSATGEDARFLSTCNASYRKDTLLKLGGFDEQFPGAYGEDRDINIKIVKNGGRLRLAKDMLIYHDRRLGLYGFARRHFNYGKGAFLIYKKYPDIKGLKGRSYIVFYQAILRKYKSPAEKILIFFLLTLSQLATAAGYLAAYVHTKGGR